MSNKPITTTPTLPEPTAPDYAVSDPKEAWERFDRLVGNVLKNSEEQPEAKGNEQVALKIKAASSK